MGKKLTGPKKREMEAAGVKFGCHCDTEAGEPPTGCVLDYECPSDCAHAYNPATGWTRKTRESCKLWLPIVPAPAPSPASVAASSGDRR